MSDWWQKAFKTFVLPTFTSKECNTQYFQEFSKFKISFIVSWKRNLSWIKGEKTVQAKLLARQSLVLSSNMDVLHVFFFFG